MDTRNPLEESIIELLQDKCKNRLSHRFIVDDRNILLEHETGEQAGIVDITEDYACAFKTEPIYADTVEDIAEKFSAGSGKVYREMSVCGSQPLATLLSLSTGLSPDASELKRSITEIASYGNTFGIPVTGGDMRFSDSGQRDLFANILTIGLIDKTQRLSSFCRCAGNPVYLIGTPVLGKQTSSNAFITRSLHELVCDLHDENAIIAVQTVDSGGIAGACAAMAASGDNGIELNTEMFTKDFPRNLAAGELNLTENIPDKLVMVLREDYGKKLEKACHKWNMRCVQVGVVIDEHKLTIKDQNNTVNLSAEVLEMFNETLPENDIELTPDAVIPESISDEKPIPTEHKEIAKFLMTCPNLSSQNWIFEQFDSTVGSNNISTNFISDATVIKIKGLRQALTAAFCQSSNNIAEYPETANLVVAEALRKVVCSGGKPLVLTGCLNYSGDIDEKILQIINKNIAMFCKKTGVASSGININHVSISGNQAVNLSIGAIAFMDDKQHQMTMSFKRKGDMIYMLGKSIDNINSSEYINKYHNVKDSQPQHVDLDEEAKLLRVTQQLIARKFVNSANSVANGGLYMALLKSALIRNFGFDITVDDEIRKDAFLFGESPSRVVVGVTPTRETDFIDFMMEADVPFMTLGHVTREEIRIDDNSYGFISDYRKKYFGQ